MKNERRRNVLGTLCVAVLLSGSVALDSPVADAAMRGDFEMVRSLLQQGSDVNAAQGDGMTALHWAAERGTVDLAQMLIYAGGSVDAVTRIGAYTPLHLASKAGNAGMIRALIDAGSDPAQGTASAEATPLHFAAASGNADAISALLDYGVDVDAREAKAGQTPLIFAASLGRVDAIKALVEGGADLSMTTEVVDMVALEKTQPGRFGRRNRRASAPAPQAQGAQASPNAEAKAQQDDECADGARGTVVSVEVGGSTVYSCDGVNSEGDEADEAEDDAEEPEEENAEEPDEEEEEEDEPRPLSNGEQVGKVGGMTALLHAVRQGHSGAVLTLLEAGADIDQVNAEGTGPLMIAVINGHFDLAMRLVEEGADPTIASEAGGTPLYATIDQQWIPKAGYAQPNVHLQQNTSYLELMETLLEAGADPNVRLEKKLWFTTYGGGLLGVNMTGASPFWRAAYATDVVAMKMLMAYGADPGVATVRRPDRRRPAWDGDAIADKSGLDPVPLGGPGVYPIHAASGVGYGQGFAANSHRHAPDGWMPSVRYLVEELGADVNARDFEGYSALHHAASRGDTELIRYLVEKGADVTVVSREGQTTADMANGPYQRTQPYPEAIALLESLGSENNHNCQSC
ncbi:MAG TPA: ankyrin repeat domain-containing protein [Gemmatimonadetes bacterium]|nr:ankyrin repeat domain-containing protein [Gemmatimonadota bacterium]